MKIVLAHKTIIEEFKNDKDYLGSIYIDFPNEDMQIDIDDIPTEAKSVLLIAITIICHIFGLIIKNLKN